MKTYGKSNISTKSKAMRIEGVPELVKTVREIAATLEGEGAAQFVERVKGVCMKPALVILHEAKDLVPVKTGKLKAGLYAAPLKQRVGAIIAVRDVPYAPFVEYGTAHNIANPYMRPAVNAARPTFAAMMAGDLQKLIADVSSANAAHPPVIK